VANVAILLRGLAARITVAKCPNPLLGRSRVFAGTVEIAKIDVELWNARALWAPTVPSCFRRSDIA
jgi:hypothetical protein